MSGQLPMTTDDAEEKAESSPDGREAMNQEVFTNFNSTGVKMIVTTPTAASISRTYRFESAHRLPMVEDGHKCKNLHGHNYKVEIRLHGKVRPDGFVRDFGVLDEVVKCWIALVDHRVLNEVPGLENPTAENIAWWFAKNVSGTPGVFNGCSIRVRVYENDDCWAQVTA